MDDLIRRQDILDLLTKDRDGTPVRGSTKMTVYHIRAAVESIPGIQVEKGREKQTPHPPPEPSAYWIRLGDCRICPSCLLKAGSFDTDRCPSCGMRLK